MEDYTRESGVRGLEKQIAKMVRDAAKNIAMDEAYEVKVTNDIIVDVLGGPKLERDKYENNEIPRQDYWGGFIVKPVSIDLWKGSTNRMHDRLLYALQADYDRTVSRLQTQL